MPIVRRPVNLELIILKKLKKGEFTYWRRYPNMLQEYLGVPDQQEMFRVLGVLAREAYIIRLNASIPRVGKQVTYRILDLGRERLGELRAKPAA